MGILMFMKLRKVNQTLLRMLIFQAGGYDKAAEKTGKCRGLLSRLVNGKYKRTLKETSRVDICDGLNVSEDELFPVVSATESKSAS